MEREAVGVGRRMAGASPSASELEAEQAEFARLLAPVIEPACRLASAMLQDPAEAEDVVQEAAFRAWRYRHRLADSSGVRSWFLAIVANQTRNALRKRQRRERLTEVLRLLPGSGITRSLQVTDERTDLRVALRRLNSDQLSVLILYYYLDLPLQDVARTLGVPEGTIKSRLNRALEALRHALAPDPAGGPT